MEFAVGNSTKIAKVRRARGMMQMATRQLLLQFGALAGTKENKYGTVRKFRATVRQDGQRWA